MQSQDGSKSSSSSAGSRILKILKVIPRPHELNRPGTKIGANPVGMLTCFLDVCQDETRQVKSYY